MLPTQHGSNPRSPDHQSDAQPTEPPRPADKWSIQKVIFTSEPKMWDHYKNTPIQIYWEFYHQKKIKKNWKLSDEKFW